MCEDTRIYFLKTGHYSLCHQRKSMSEVKPWSHVSVSSITVEPILRDFFKVYIYIIQ